MKPIAMILLAAAFACGITACSKGTSSGDSNDDLTIAINIDPTQLNGILEQNAIESFTDRLLFDQLVEIDDRGNAVPDLARVVPSVKNGGISKNGLTITYHLRTNALWQDGVPVTSQDVKFTWQAIMNPNNNVLSHHGYDQVASIDTPDAHTVVMHMKRIFPPAIDMIFGESDQPYYILPSHLLARYPNLNNIPFNSNPVGSGPYRFARWLRGDRIVLVANPNYFGGAPAIKQLTLKIITDDNTTEAQLRTHEAQLAIEITGPTYQDLANDPNVTRQLVTSPMYVALYFNTKHQPLDDVSVRRALALGLDRAQIVKTDTYGSGIEAVADLSPFYWAFDRSIRPIPYDPAQARALLDAAGWRVGPSGVRMRAGKPLSLQLAYGQGSQLARNVTLQIQQMLRPLGVDVQLKSYDYQVLYAAQESGGILNGGKFDMALYSWIAGGDPDDSSQWLCSMAPPVGNNVTRYCSPAMDADQRLALSTFDRAKRIAAYASIQRRLLTDVPAIFLYYRPQQYAHVSDLKNFAPNGITESWNADSWTF